MVVRRLAGSQCRLSPPPGPAPVPGEVSLDFRLRLGKLLFTLRPLPSHLKTSGSFSDPLGVTKGLPTTTRNFLPSNWLLETSKYRSGVWGLVLGPGEEETWLSPLECLGSSTALGSPGPAWPHPDPLSPDSLVLSHSLDIKTPPGR